LTGLRERVAAPPGQQLETTVHPGIYLNIRNSFTVKKFAGGTSLFSASDDVDKIIPICFKNWGFIARRKRFDQKDSGCVANDLTLAFSFTQ